MSADTIITTGAPSSVPQFIGQNAIDTAAKVTYTAYGTSNASDWQQDGGGGSGGGFGISSAQIVTIDGSGSTVVDWDCSTTPTLSVKAVDTTEVDIEINPSTFPDDINEVLHAKLTVEIGEDTLSAAINLNINAGGSVLGNGYRFYYVDEHDSVFLNGSGFGAAELHQVITYNIEIYAHGINQSSDDGYVMVTKVGQTGVTVTSSGGS